MKEMPFIVYVTKGWDSKNCQGIREIEVKTSISSDNIVIDVNNRLNVFCGGEWHLSYKLAAINLRELRERKIKALEKKLEAIKAMTF